MSKISVIIVDDEEEAREGLKTLIGNSEDYALLEVAGNGLEAVNLINKKKPDVVLLDIQMPEINGFDVLNNLKEPIPAIIFVTAFDQYALKAFEHHAVDYILKPFTNQRLFQALSHAKSRIDQIAMNDKLKLLLNDYQKDKLIKENDAIIHASPNEVDLSKRMVIKSMGKIHFVELQDICWIEAYDYYIKIHVAERYYLVRKSLRSMEELLPSAEFFRIHKSSIINIRHLKELQSKNNGDYCVTMINGKQLNLSRNYRSCLEQLLQTQV
jgi:two-component system LytT family response regulator